MLELPPPTQVGTFSDMLGNMLGLENARLKNQQLQQQTSMQPSIDQANLALLQAQVPHVQADTAHTNITTQFYPQQMKIAQENADVRQQMLNQSRSRFNTPQYQAYMASRVVGPQAMSNFNQHNPGMAANLLVNSLLGTSTPANSLTAASANTSTPSGSSVSTSGQASPPVTSAAVTPFPVTPTADQVSQIQQGAANEYAKDTAPPNIQSQRYYANTAANIFNLQNQFLPQVSQYATAKGFMNKSMDQLMSSLGQNSPQYQSYLNYKQSVPIMTNELRRVLGGQATDKEQALLSQVANPKLGSLTPQQFLDLHKNLGDLLNTVSSPLANTYATVASNLGHEAQSNGSSTVMNSPTNPPSATFSMAEVNDYAKRKNLTPQQVITQLKQQGYQVDG